MWRKLWLPFLILGWIYPARAQTPDTASHRVPALRVSLLTCGVGDEAWETFGHTAVRVIDSSATGDRRDLVFNYGMFNGFDKDFELNFMRGKLLYYIGIQTFDEFMFEYQEARRTVWEQELVMAPAEKQSILDALVRNTLPENKYYKYDFFFDNCATRIRDIIPHTLGNAFVYGNSLPAGKALSFRDIINRYFYYKHWTRTGVNILLGSRIDRHMTNSEIMFLPDFLSKGLLGASKGGMRVSSDTHVILKGIEPPGTGVDGPLLLTLTVALLTIAGVSVPRLRILGRIMTSLLLLVTGLLGVLVLVMWFGTNHQTCADNYNLLWLLSTNLVLLVSKPKGRGKYALLAIALIFVTLLLHILSIQMITIVEIGPLLLALLFAYAGIWKRSLTTKPVYA
jgi:hypothetical protein